MKNMYVPQLHELSGECWGYFPGSELSSSSISCFFKLLNTCLACCFVMHMRKLITMSCTCHIHTQNCDPSPAQTPSHISSGERVENKDQPIQSHTHTHSLMLRICLITSLDQTQIKVTCFLRFICYWRVATVNLKIYQPL